MATSSTSVTAGEIMDRSAVLMNDPLKTDYTYNTLIPFLQMALEELTEILIDSQNSPTITMVSGIILPIGKNAIYATESLIEPNYPVDLVEIQEIAERTLGSEGSFISMKRVEYINSQPAGNMLEQWMWSNQIIVFNPAGATTPRELQLKYIRSFNSTVVVPDAIVGSINSRSYLAYKTAAYAAMFIGENKERADVLEAQAQKALERIESINNKGRQQIMTRHRPFRATFKMHGGF